MEANMLKELILPEDKMMTAIKHEVSSRFIEMLLVGGIASDKKKAQAVMATLEKVAKRNLKLGYSDKSIPPLNHEKRDSEKETENTLKITNHATVKTQSTDRAIRRINKSNTTGSLVR